MVLLGIFLSVEFVGHRYTFFLSIVLELGMQNYEINYETKINLKHEIRTIWRRKNNMEKHNILFMGIHSRSSKLTLFVLISKWQDFESVLTWPFSAGLLLPQCSCHIYSSSPNLESVMGSGISSFVFFSGTRLLISPCSHLRKWTDSCQDESLLFLRHTWRPNL